MSRCRVVPKVIQILQRLPKSEGIKRAALAKIMAIPKEDVNRHISLARRNYTIYTTPRGYTLVPPTDPADYLYEIKFRMRNIDGNLSNGTTAIVRGLKFADREIQQIVGESKLKIRKCLLLFETVDVNGDSQEHTLKLSVQ